MPAPLRVVRASELGEYLYCRRAWWLHQVRGYASSKGQRLAEGTAAHAGHGRQVGLAAALRVLAVLLFIVAVWLLVAPVVLH